MGEALVTCDMGTLGGGTAPVIVPFRGLDYKGDAFTIKDGVYRRSPPPAGEVVPFSRRRDVATGSSSLGGHPYLYGHQGLSGAISQRAFLALNQL